MIEEIKNALEQSYDKTIEENFIQVNHGGYEYHIYKIKESDAQKLAELDEEIKSLKNKIDSEIQPPNSTIHHPDFGKLSDLCEELKKLHEKTNWFYFK